MLFERRVFREASAELWGAMEPRIAKRRHGSIFLLKMEITKSDKLRHSADDEAPSDLVTLASRDGRLLIVYEASKYESLTGPGHGDMGQTGKVGRHRMHLKLAIMDLEWLYE